MICSMNSPSRASSSSAAGSSRSRVGVVPVTARSSFSAPASWQWRRASAVRAREPRARCVPRAAPTHRRGGDRRGSGVAARSRGREAIRASASAAIGAPAAQVVELHVEPLTVRSPSPASRAAASPGIGAVTPRSAPRCGRAQRSQTAAWAAVNTQRGIALLDGPGVARQVSTKAGSTWNTAQSIQRRRRCRPFLDQPVDTRLDHLHGEHASRAPPARPRPALPPAQ